MWSSKSRPTKGRHLCHSFVWDFSALYIFVEISSGLLAWIICLRTWEKRKWRAMNRLESVSKKAGMHICFDQYALCDQGDDDHILSQKNACCDWLGLPEWIMEANNNPRTKDMICIMATCPVSGADVLYSKNYYF